ncbi:major facilitator superfamily domain-containing protein [Fomitopsis serialis]|uniref:major facilitator superfamily domain-containing protein n=1 Tax=Fomitopsis serialis TaxID=139415 RepID=UPI0020080DA7|nr:major facilitator superfamily domain-containing protein [Neoantrodia serialis]KAH9917767.1 major facilitator superfamily domain-containing protein [Neoantrodia serialis]
MGPTHQRDFGVLPVPIWLRHQEDKPLHFGLFLNAMFGIFACFTVSNLYYCQPILGNLASSFGISEDRVSKSVLLLLTRFSYAGGLLLVTPLGDMVQRRQLILLLVLISASLTIGLAITRSLVVFEVITFLVGFTSCVPQILIPLAADLAPIDRKAGATAIVWAALMLGVLFARVLSGVITNFVTYRAVYWLATGLQFAVLAVAYLIIPNVPPKNLGLSYAGILWSMAKLLVTHPLLIQCALCMIVSNICFTNFWVTLTFLLLDAPFHYSSLDIGLFGLLGMLGVLLGPFLGRILDFIYPWWGAVAADGALLVFQAVMVIGAGLNIAPVIIATLGLDVFRQTTAVSLVNMAFAVDPRARSRINAVMSVSLFIGQMIGTSASTTVFLRYGWRACYGMALALTGVQGLILLLRGPHCPKGRWFGCAGGLAVRKPVHTSPAPAATASPEPEKVEDAEDAGEGEIGAKTV